MSAIRIFDDEIIARKVFTDLDKKSKYAKNFKTKNPSRYDSNKNKNINKPNNEVVIKIISNCKNNQAISRHIDYITRKGELDLIDSYDDKLNGIEGKEEAKIIFKNEGVPIPNENEEKREKRQTINFIFSMKKTSNATKEQMIEATTKTLKEHFPNNFFVATFHGDTDNPHCHICLKVADENGKRINPKKQDLENLRTIFARELNNVGIEAKATIRPKNKKEIAKNSFTELQKTSNPKAHYYEVMDFGEANYKFQKDSKKSYFVKYKTSKDELVEIWGKDLERVIKENNVKKYEYARFKIVDKQPVTVQVKKVVNGEEIIAQKEIFTAVWDVSVFGREKDLKSPPPHKPKFSLIRLGAIKERFTKKQEVKQEIAQDVLESKNPKLERFLKSLDSREISKNDLER